MKKNNFSIKILSAVLTLSLGVMSASAAVLTTLSDTMSSVKINNLSNHDFSFVTPSGVASGDTIVLTFPATFSIPVGLTFADVDVLDNGSQITLASTPSGATAGVARTSSTVLTFTNGTSAITAGDTIRIKIGTNATNQSVGTFQITNAGTVGNKAIDINGSFGDTGTTTVDLLSDDQVVVNAVVPQSFTFSISANAINFGALGATGAKYASSTETSGDTIDTVAHTLTIASNASAGYTITLLGQTLTSQQNSGNTITANGPSPAVSATGTEQFGIYATSAGGIGATIATPYATPASFGFDATATSSSIFASGSSSSGTTVYSLHYIANISSLTEAGTYSAGLIYVGTSNF
jgi:hypothetical protein